MLDLVCVADHVEAALARIDGVSVTRLLGELDAIIGQDRVQPVGHDDQDLFQELDGRAPCCLIIKPHHGKFRRAINGYEQIELSLTAAHLGNVDMEKPDRIGLELLLGQIAFDIGQS